MGKLSSKKLFLVNKHTGRTLEWKADFGRSLPPYSFFKLGNFLKEGQIVELVELGETETSYFGVIKREDKLNVLERGRLDLFQMKKLE